MLVYQRVPDFLGKKNLPCIQRTGLRPDGCGNLAVQTALPRRWKTAIELRDLWYGGFHKSWGHPKMDGLYMNMDDLRVPPCMETLICWWSMTFDIALFSMETTCYQVDTSKIGVKHPPTFCTPNPEFDELVECNGFPAGFPGKPNPIVLIVVGSSPVSIAINYVLGTS